MRLNVKSPGGPTSMFAGIVSLLFVGLVFASAGLTAKSANNVKSRAYLHGNNIPASGVALEGYSPVAYFTQGKAVRGNLKWSAEHNGVTYLFASEREKGMFRNDPEKYNPAFGGWCAFGMAIGDKFPVDPTNFKIVDGRLFLFLRNENIDALPLWNKENESNLIEKAEVFWKKVRG